MQYDLHWIFTLLREGVVFLNSDASPTLGSFRTLMKPQNVYMLLVSMAGILTFAMHPHQEWGRLATSDWLLFATLVGTVLLLNHFTFQLPPEGNAQSMDSAVYLAVLFVYGLSMSLYVLLASTLIYAMYERRIVWWKQAANFAVYTMMIAMAYVGYMVLQGQIGPIQVGSLHANVVSLVVYFAVNVLLVGIYFHFAKQGHLLEVVRSLSLESLNAYISTLLLSIVLSILLTEYELFGMFLFLCVSISLSYAFNKFFVMYSEVRDKAIKDPRTGLYTHGYFEERLEEEIRRAKETKSGFSLILLDLDNFRKYNDHHGHLKGDQLIEFFAGLLKEACSTPSYVVARYGGGEFAIMMLGSSGDEAYPFLTRLRKRVNDTYFDGVEHLPHRCLSFSAGISFYRTDTYDRSLLVHEAREALHYAKSSGKNAIHLYDEHSMMQRELDFEQDIREIEQQLKIFLSKDVYTFQHSQRVYQYAIEMADRLELTEHERRILVLGALFHDIGKVEIPRDVLNKKGKLTREEWEMIQKHVLWGREIVSTYPKYKDLIPLVELHHEKYDGTGYPKQLAGEEIPKLARILTVIDSFDAMTTERPYQQTKTLDEAVSELRRCAGKHFDPHIADVFIEMIQSKKYHHHLVQ